MRLSNVMVSFYEQKKEGIHKFVAFYEVAEKRVTFI